MNREDYEAEISQRDARIDELTLKCQTLHSEKNDLSTRLRLVAESVELIRREKKIQESVEEGKICGNCRFVYVCDRAMMGGYCIDWGAVVEEEELLLSGTGDSVNCNTCIKFSTCKKHLVKCDKQKYTCIGWISKPTVEIKTCGTCGIHPCVNRVYDVICPTWCKEV